MRRVFLALFIPLSPTPPETDIFRGFRLAKPTGKGARGLCANVRVIGLDVTISKIVENCDCQGASSTTT